MYIRYVFINNNICIYIYGFVFRSDKAAKTQPKSILFVRDLLLLLSYNTRYLFNKNYVVVRTGTLIYTCKSVVCIDINNIIMHYSPSPCHTALSLPSVHSTNAPCLSLATNRPCTTSANST